MFNYLMHSRIFKHSVACLITGLLLSLSSISWAGECRMNNGYGAATTLVNSEYAGGTVRLPAPGGYLSSSFNVNLSPGVQANCGPGNDGYNMMSQTSTELYKGTHYGQAMFETNIPGIFYSVRVHTAESDGGAGGYFAMNTTGWTNIYSSPNSDMWDGRWFKTTVYIFISDEYKGNPNKATVIKPKAGTLGKMSLGDPNDSNNKPYTFLVNENSFQVPIILPTCDVAMLSDGGNEVNLGDYFVSDIKNNRVKDVPFSITLNNCTSVAKFTTKLTTSKLTGTSNDLLGNTLASGAEGAGVKIMYNGTSQLRPNNPNSSYIMSNDTIPTSTQIDYVAQLVANGSTVKPGSFKATGVFTLSYD